MNSYGGPLARRFNARAVLTALHYPTGPPKEAKASSLFAREDDLCGSGRGTDESTDWPEYPD